MKSLSGFFRKIFAAFDPYPGPSPFQKKAGRVLRSVLDAKFEKGLSRFPNPGKDVLDVPIFPKLTIDLRIPAQLLWDLWRVRLGQEIKLGQLFRNPCIEPGLFEFSLCLRADFACQLRGLHGNGVRFFQECLDEFTQAQESLSFIFSQPSHKARLPSKCFACETFRIMISSL